jgi:hypothetical protein
MGSASPWKLEHGTSTIEVVCSNRREHRKRVDTRLGTVPGLRLPTWQEVVEREYHGWTVDRVVVDTFGRSERECVDELLAKTQRDA